MKIMTWIDMIIPGDEVSYVSTCGDLRLARVTKSAPIWLEIVDLDDGKHRLIPRGWVVTVDEASARS